VNSAPLKKANSPYGNTKQICEDILRDTMNSTQGKGVISLRYFNPIGAHPSACIGELPLGIPNNLVPFITQTAAGLREYLSVYGDDYNTPDGSAIRDYINVVDLARAHVIAIRRLLDKQQLSDFEVFNLGTGRGLFGSEIIQAFEKSTGQKLAYK
jgi:UDP-glucose 4-epimerase